MEKLNELIVVAGLVALAFWAVGELIKDRFSKLPPWGKILVLVGLIGLAAGDVLWRQTGAIRASNVTIYIPEIQSQAIIFRTTMTLWQAAMLAMIAALVPPMTRLSAAGVPVQTHKIPSTNLLAAPENFTLMFMLSYTSFRTNSGVPEGSSVILTIGARWVSV